MARYRNEDTPTPQTQEITAEDVMDKLDAILEAVKSIDSKKSESNDVKTVEQPQNSFARLFNMNTK